MNRKHAIFVMGFFRRFPPGGRLFPGISRNSFTLIECLVILFIIALLATLLLPALGGSLQSGLSIQCLGNLRQLGQAFLQYEQNHDGFLPIGLSSHAPTEHGGTNWARLMLPYLQDIRILDCPVSPDPSPDSSPRSLHLYDGNYGWNFDGTQGRHGPVFTRIRDCARTYLVFDSGDQCITFWSNKWDSLMEELDLDWNSGKEGCNRHRGQVNICFLDSHADSLSLDAFLAVPNPSGHPPWHIRWSEPVLQKGKIPYPGR